MALTAPERTTTINFDDDGTTAHITTYSRVWLTSLRKNPSAIEVSTPFVKNSGGGEFILPKQLVSIRRARVDAGKKRGPMSEEHKAKLLAGRLAAKKVEA